MPEPLEELPDSEKEALPTWPVPDHKYGLPFTIFPRHSIAEDIHTWMVRQGWVEDRRDETPPDNLPPS